MVPLGRTAIKLLGAVLLFVSPGRGVCVCMCVCRWEDALLNLHLACALLGVLECKRQAYLGGGGVLLGMCV